MPNNKLIIAIDGYSSCGKSSFAKLIARHLHYTYIDSGAMYRAFTLELLNRNGLEQNEINTRILDEIIKTIDISFKYNPDHARSETILNGKNVEETIRTDENVANLVSMVSANKEVRDKLVQIQRLIGNTGGIVMDGRDIGTVVFPQAHLKIFMTADPEIRAERRFNELIEKGINTSFDAVKQNINERDYTDTHRSESPLKQADDALVLDNSSMTLHEQLDWILPIIQKKRTQFSLN